MTERDLSWLRRTPIAHRGLHDQTSNIPENSLAAFRGAIDAGYAIELDLQPSRDGEAVVFHDEELARMTGTIGRVCERLASDLNRLQLQGTLERIPLLSEVLSLVAGRVPLLIELKTLSRKVGLLEARTASLLANYTGPVAIQSFNPYSVRWFRDHAPDIPRGLLSSRFRRTAQQNLPWRTRFTLRHLLMAPIVRPQFIGYDIRALPALAPALARRLGLPLLAWTVASADDRQKSARLADNIIFEGFRAPLAQAA